jgi:hypothetical protein
MKTPNLLSVGVSALLISLSSGLAFAAPARDSSQWLQHYYENPQPDQVVPAVFALSRSGYFESAGQPATAIGFLSGLFARNPDRVSGWMTAFRGLPDAHQRIVASALWYSGLPGGADQVRALARNSNPALRDEIDQMLAQTNPSLRDTPVRSESSLNLQWGAFLATGEPQHIVNVLTALGSSEPGLSAAARLALAEKAAGHHRVYEICQAQLSRQPAHVRDQMQAALASVKVQP